MEYHSHTLEKRSSLPPKPPGGFVDACIGGLVAAGVSGAALLQPPKSSSAAILGVSLKLLLAPKFDFVVVVEFPQDEKSLVVVIAGDLVSALGFDAVEGSGVAQALSEPQGSSLENPEKAFVLTGATGADLAAGCETGAGAGAERLKAELKFEGAGFEDIVGCDGKGSEKSKRSLEGVIVGCFVIGAVFEVKLKSPRPFEAPGVCDGLIGCTGGFDAVTGFGVGFVPVSKKPPPLSGGVGLIGGEVKLDRCVGGLLKLAKGSVLEVDCGCGDVVEAKLRLLNASLRPPDVDGCCEVGDCMPPKISWLSC